ncbi:hypothetical protein HK405_007040, partial [Cladochytrium tenue]
MHHPPPSTLTPAAVAASPAGSAALAVAAVAAHTSVPAWDHHPRLTSAASSHVASRRPASAAGGTVGGGGGAAAYGYAKDHYYDDRDCESGDDDDGVEDDDDDWMLWTYSYPRPSSLILYEGHVRVPSCEEQQSPARRRPSGTPPLSAIRWASSTASHLFSHKPSLTAASLSTPALSSPSLSPSPSPPSPPSSPPPATELRRAVLIAPATTAAQIDRIFLHLFGLPVAGIFAAAVAYVGSKDTRTPRSGRSSSSRPGSRNGNSTKGGGGSGPASVAARRLSSATASLLARIGAGAPSAPAVAPTSNPYVRCLGHLARAASLSSPLLVLVPIAAAAQAAPPHLLPAQDPAACEFVHLADVDAVLDEFDLGRACRVALRCHRTPAAASAFDDVTAPGAEGHRRRRLVHLAFDSSLDYADAHAALAAAFAAAFASSPHAPPPPSVVPLSAPPPAVLPPLLLHASLRPSPASLSSRAPSAASSRSRQRQRHRPVSAAAAGVPSRIPARPLAAAFDPTDVAAAATATSASSPARPQPPVRPHGDRGAPPQRYARFESEPPSAASDPDIALPDRSGTPLFDMRLASAASAASASSSVAASSKISAALARPSGSTTPGQATAPATAAATAHTPPPPPPQPRLLRPASAVGASASGPPPRAAPLPATLRSARRPSAASTSLSSSANSPASALLASLLARDPAPAVRIVVPVTASSSAADVAGAA